MTPKIVTPKKDYTAQTAVDTEIMLKKLHLAIVNQAVRDITNPAFPLNAKDVVAIYTTLVDAGIDSTLIEKWFAPRVNINIPLEEFIEKLTYDIVKDKNVNLLYEKYINKEAEVTLEGREGMKLSRYEKDNFPDIYKAKLEKKIAQMKEQYANGELKPYQINSALRPHLSMEEIGKIFGFTTRGRLNEKEGIDVARWKCYQYYKAGELPIEAYRKHKEDINCHWTTMCKWWDKFKNGYIPLEVY